MKTSKDLATDSVKNELSKRAPEKFAHELDLFLCNSCLGKKDQIKLIKIINKLVD
jgi:hypothetical protein